jgi:hypothetical protein
MIQGAYTERVHVRLVVDAAGGLVGAPIQKEKR